MTSTTSPELEIAVAPRERQTSALLLVMAGMEPSLRTAQVASTLAAANRDELSLAGLFEARRGQKTVAAVWANILPGHTALVWPPQRIIGEDADTSGKLLEAVEQYMRQEGVRLGQVVLSHENLDDNEILSAAGYREGVDLLYLASEGESLPLEEPTCAELQFESYNPSNHQRLAAVVRETYEATQDCPALNDVRNIDDVLEGYRQTGVFDAENWLLVRHGGKDVGCLLLADYPREEQVELVYMGVIAQHRGHNLGLAITRYAQWRTRCAGRKRLVLAVDKANRPARAMYEAAGFAAWERRRVLLKVFS